MYKRAGANKWGALVKHYTDTPIDEGNRAWESSGLFWGSSETESLPAPEERREPMAMGALDLGEYSSESLRDEYGLGGRSRDDGCEERVS